ncbi:MAG: hypothetical protein Q7J34_08475 [Bacteroidales bacterium]|nr:hypothetical protein [Bacteroidales bacterium]
MKSTFKKTSILVLFMLTVLFGCENDMINDKTATSPSLKNDISELETFGIEHNQGLDYIYKRLVIAIDSSRLVLDSSSYIDLLEFVQASTHDFFIKNENILISDNSYQANKSADFSFSWVVNSNLNQNLWDVSVDSYLTAKQKELLTVLSNAVYDTNLDIDTTLLIFDQVYRTAITDCSSNELVVIIAAIEIGTNSLLYWNKNHEAWINLFQPSCKSWFNWKKVAGSDIQGAVTGGVTGGITGAGAGIGALGGGLGASAGSIAVQLWNHWFDK